MRPTEILSNEHRVIEQVLDCLEIIARRGQAQGRLDGPSAADAVEFFRNFADRCHHGKEEAHLFPAMEAKGFPRDGGPTGVMLHEHEEGRAHVRGMAEAIDSAAAGDPTALEQFVRHARGYIDLLREHIRKEDHCLFSMANQAFTDDDQQSLLEAFERVEHEHMGAGTHERFLQIAEDLAERFGVPRAAHSGVSCSCGH
jgi:hemerythrin-like domain-containing protein